MKTKADSLSHKEWANVDKSADPQAYIRFLDASREQTLKRIEQDPKAYFAPSKPESGLSILEVGCGTGSLLHPLAKLLQPSGKVVGIDFSQTMVDEARRRAEGTGLPLGFHKMDAANMSFSDNTFDRASSNIVFQHLPDPAAALREMVRVTKPGGLVTIMEQDWDTIVVDSADKSTTRRIVEAFSDAIRNGWIGRQLYGMFVRAGLSDITVRPETYIFLVDQWPVMRNVLERAGRDAVQAGAINTAQLEAWMNDLEQKASMNQFFAAFTLFRVSGTKSVS